MLLLLQSSYSYCVAMAYSSITRWPGRPANKRRPSYGQEPGDLLLFVLHRGSPKSPRNGATKPGQHEHSIHILSILPAEPKKPMVRKRARLGRAVKASRRQLSALRGSLWRRLFEGEFNTFSFGTMIVTRSWPTSRLTSSTGTRKVFSPTPRKPPALTTR